MAGSLTTQVRAIADVSTAVTQGDLTRSIDVEAKGEVAELKDNINQMISTSPTRPQRNAEQDWLNSNLARFSGMMQGQRDLKAVSRLIMCELTPLVVRAPRRRSSSPKASDEEREAPARRELRLQAAQEGRERVQGRRGARRPGGAREAVDPDHRSAGGLHPDRVGTRRGRAAQHHRDARPLRGRGDGRDRARGVPRRSLQRS